MWKKGEEPAEQAAPRTQATGRPEGPARERPRGERATIGRSIKIRGDVTGDEDLLIQGEVEGSVDLEQHSVTVGPDGEVKASISGRVVTVEGVVEGDLTAQEQAILRSTATVQGDISAPRVVLEDGATFRGGVDMGEASGKGGRDRGKQPASAGTQAPSGKDGTRAPSTQTQGSQQSSTDKAKSSADTPARAGK